MAVDTKLWIGGSSGLARTYWNAFPDSSWIFVGRRSVAPEWVRNAGVPYVACDLVELASSTNNDLLDNIMEQLHSGNNKISQAVIGIRPALLTKRTNAAAFDYCHHMVKGLELLLEALVQQHPPNLILHVSSIAAIGHCDSQHLHSVSADDPPSHALDQPYDRFKRASEERLEELCTKNDIRFTHLRLSAIFAEDESCFQSFVLSLQSMGPYVPTCIDHNSARNAAKLIHLVLKDDNKQLRPVYYYTRCLKTYPDPVPYGEWLLTYRQVLGLSSWLPLLVPVFFVDWCFIRPLNIFVIFLRSILDWIGLPMVPYLDSLNYLMQMVFVEHTFDLKPVQEDFPELEEDSIEDCFARRCALLSKKSL